MSVKIISDELITQINDQLRASVNEMIKRELRDYLENIDWSQEVDFGSIVQDEVQNELSNSLTDVVSDELEQMLPSLTISKGY
jgi:type III secretory pathway component EscR|tara:strand:+ start:202 stop:450 length:249 start_codon:yes stop_codon:yes gene_type:complete